MKRTTFFTLIGLLLFLAALFYIGFQYKETFIPDTNPNQVKWHNSYTEILKEFKLGNLPDYLSNQAEVKALFGAPVHVIPSPDSNQEEWVYSDKKIRFNSGFVIQVTVTSPDYPTVLGVKVGDSVDKLKKSYPDLQLNQSEQEFVYEKWAQVTDKKQTYPVYFRLGFRYDAGKTVTEIWRSSGSL